MARAGPAEFYNCHLFITVNLTLGAKTSIPQLPFETPQIPSKRDHKALNRRTLEDPGRQVFIESCSVEASGVVVWCFEPGGCRQNITELASWTENSGYLPNVRRVPYGTEAFVIDLCGSAAGER